MCQPVSGPEFEIKKPIVAWKVVSKEDYRQGPFYETYFVNAWAKKVRPSRSIYSTQSGYHVFATREQARGFIGKKARWYKNEGEKVLKVLIKGKAIPFDGYCGKGYAVETWRKHP